MYSWLASEDSNSNYKGKEDEAHVEN